MANLLPQQIETPNFAVLYTGNLAMKLPRMQFGDSKQVALRQRINRDLIVRGRWPRDRSYTVRFGGLRRDGVLPSNNMVAVFRESLRLFPGAQSRLVLADGTQFTGVVLSPSIHEARSRGVDSEGRYFDCQYDVSFQFDIYNETGLRVE